MTQNHTTTTIERFLKSRYRNPVNNQLDGLALDEDGNFLHYNKIIDQTYNELFKDMHLKLLHPLSYINNQYLIV
jgi:hypothetical protein